MTESDTTISGFRYPETSSPCVAYATFGEWLVANHPEVLLSRVTIAAAAVTRCIRWPIPAGVALRVRHAVNCRAAPTIFRVEGRFHFGSTAKSAVGLARMACV